MSLNPFDIRASVRTDEDAVPDPWRRVLIPLISGHQSGPDLLIEAADTIGLNPFDIGASVRTRNVAEMSEREQVLIPLISGHQSGLLAKLEDDDLVS